MALSRKNPEIEAFFKEVDGSEGFSIAFDKNKQSELIAKINQILDEMKKDGSYDALLKKIRTKNNTSQLACKFSRLALSCILKFILKSAFNIEI